MISRERTEALVEALNDFVDGALLGQIDEQVVARYAADFDSFLVLTGLRRTTIEGQLAALQAHEESALSD